MKRLWSLPFLFLVIDVSHAIYPPLLRAGGSTKAMTAGAVKWRKRRKNLVVREDSSIIVTPPNDPVVLPSSSAQSSSSIPSTTTPRREARQESTPFHWLVHKIDGIVATSYFGNVFALTLPIILLPIASKTYASSHGDIGTMVANVSSVASLGGAVGKFVNGFVCQALGSRRCSQLYFCGLSLSSVFFSFAHSPAALSRAYASMEFFASAQWVALSVMLAEHYSHSPLKLAAAVTALGLSSTSGQLIAKTAGVPLASMLHWRTVSRIGALVALLSALSICRVPKSRPTRTNAPSFSLKTVTKPLAAILTSPHFYILGFAHGMTFVARASERILGTYFQHVVQDMSPATAGGLTSVITIGLVYGLMTGTATLAKAKTTEEKKQCLIRWYVTQVLAAVGLAVTSLPFVLNMLPSHAMIRTLLVAFLASSMIANVSCQFYQFPNQIAKTFYPDHQPVAIGFLDGCGFLLVAPVVAGIGAIVPRYGWATAWGMLAALFGMASVLMLRFIGPAL